MLRKVLTLSVAALCFIAVGAFANGQKEGSSSSATAKSAGPPIVVTARPNGGFGAFMKKALAKEGIGGKFQPLSGTSDAQLNYYTERLAAGSSTPDIMNMDIVWPAQFYSAGWLLSIDKYLTKKQLDQYLPSYIHALTVQGHVVAFPAQADSLILYYRKDLLKKYGFNGPPKTWAELVKQAQTILKGENNPNLSGFLFQGANIEGLLANYLEFLWGMGGSLLNSQGKVAVNRPTNVKALQQMLDLVYKDKVVPKGITTMATDPSRVAFQDGRAIFLLNWNYAWALFQGKDSSVKGDVGMTTPPTSPGYQPHVALGGWQWAINKYTKDPEKAIKVAEYLSSFAIQKDRVLQLSNLPTRLDVYQDPAVQKQLPWLDGFLPLIKTGRNRPRSAEYNQVSKAIRDQLSAALAQIKSPQQALDAAQKSLEKLTILPQ